MKTSQQRRWEERRAAIKALYDELADVLEIAVARGEQLGYADDDYRKRLDQIRPGWDGDPIIDHLRPSR